MIYSRSQLITSQAKIQIYMFHSLKPQFQTLCIILLACLPRVAANVSKVSLLTLLICRHRTDTVLTSLPDADSCRSTLCVFFFTDGSLLLFRAIMCPIKNTSLDPLQLVSMYPSFFQGNVSRCQLSESSPKAIALLIERGKLSAFPFTLHILPPWNGDMMSAGGAAILQPSRWQLQTKDGRMER